MSSADRTVLRFIEETTPGVMPDDSAKATGTLTGTANLANNDTVTIGTKVYTFQSVLTNVDGNVKIGATLTATLLNLKNAINRNAGVPGTDYAMATIEHTSVEATASNATTVSLRAKIGGTAGNAIATTETSAVASFGGTTLAGGTNSTLTALEQIRYTGESLNFNIENITSDEITPARTQTDLIQVGADTKGNINFELSFGSFTKFLAGALCGSWVSGGGDLTVLDNGTTVHTFTIQKNFADMTPQQYHTYKGCVIDGFNFKAEIGSIVKGDFAVMGRGVDVSDSQIGGATFPAVSTTSPLNAVSNLQSFSIDGVPYSGCISAINMEFKNNLRPIKCIGSLAPTDHKLGTLEVTGTMDFYFNDGSLYGQFVDGTEFSFSFVLIDAAGNKYTVTVYRAKFESGEVVAGGKNSDVMFKAKWRALQDTVTGRVVRIEADPA